MSYPLLLVNPKKELFRWGPVPGRLFFMSEFNQAFFVSYPKRFAPHMAPNTAELFFDDRLLWTNEAHSFEEAGKKVFLDWILPEDHRGALYKEYQEAVQKLRTYQEILAEEDLCGLTQAAFLEIWNTFYQLVDACWIPTIPAEIGNYGSPVLVEGALKSAVPMEEVPHLMEILTAPECLSFYQEEEIALSETNDLDAHTNAYFWLKNSYGNVERLAVTFFAERKKQLEPNLRARMHAHLEEVKRKKREAIASHHLSDEIVALARGLHDALVWQDERKRQIIETHVYKQLLLEEMASRLDVVASDLYLFSYDELPLLLEATDVNARITKRKEGCFVDLGSKDGEPIIQISEPGAQEMKKFWDAYLDERITNMTEFKGIAACKGKGIIRGRVKILLRPEALETFPEGSVLVAPMTSPEYIFAMKRASAILTDTGGLTSHAAIVSRELNVPCLVGTKVATKLLKDGDEVEVDAEKGIVRILSKE